MMSTVGAVPMSFYTISDKSGKRVDLDGLFRKNSLVVKGFLGVMSERYLDCKFTRIPRFCSLIAWNRKTWSSGYSTKPFVTVEHRIQGLNYPDFLLQCRCFENCYMNLVVSNPHFCNLSTQHDRMALVELHEQMLCLKLN